MRPSVLHQTKAVPVWKRGLELADINAICRGTIHDALGIEFLAVEDGRLVATMPVNASTHQPFGFLHGGASVVLAESLGSMAAYLACEENEVPAGIEVNANHLRAVREGIVIGTATAIHLGRSLQVWSVEIRDAAERLVCVARLTVSILTPRAPAT